MNPRGLTMVELLLALVLLASIISACAVWMSVAASASVTAGATARRDAVVQAALTRIQDDLVTGDFTTRQPHADAPRNAKQDGRVRVNHGTLEIDLRRGVSCTYRIERGRNASARLVRDERSGANSETRPVVAQIEDFQCIVDDVRRELTVTIELAPESSNESPAQRSVVTRRYRFR